MEKDSTQEKNDPFEMRNKPMNPYLRRMSYILGIVRVPLFFLMYLITFIYSHVALVLPILSLRRFFTRYYSFILYKVMLYFTGNLLTKEEVVRLDEETEEKGKASKIGKGDIIFANCASYLNFIWLSSNYSPLFAFPVDEQNFVLKTFHEILITIFKEEKLNEGSTLKLEEIIDLAKNKFSCPIVIFPEAQVSNGEQILEFVPIRTEGIDENTKFHIMCFKHDYTGFTPNFTRGNAFNHFCMMGGRLYARMSVKRAADEYVPFHNGKIDKASLDEARVIMAKLIEVPLYEIIDSTQEKEKTD